MRLGTILSLRGNRHSQHLQRGVIVVGVIVVVDVTIVGIDVNVRAGTGRRGGPVVVVGPARRHIAYPLALP